ncbi:putative Phase-1 flagellin [Candidatus Terasakiella magnetica]|uniref:Putative Phase-1 flagellin n=1 Tax=Candidatus Terasakiella magnetica TaxID=1867952 RepID=A0A1C3RKT4_9PROT|nr:flagellin [Candidatus Terasakiella magnetica]SCA57873.1 putative Phase-1 flagellin [Candidatus Terasakiella magnetica]
MSRVTDLSTQQLLVRQMMRTQQNLTEAEIQVTTEKKTQVYSGIVAQSHRLVSLEVSKTLSERYVQNNQTAELRLDSASTSLEAIEKSVSEFHRRLQSYKSNLSNPPVQDDTQELQKWALSSLKDLQSYLNLDVDGQYLFSGTKTTTQPVDLGLSTIDAFQAEYDGQKIKYPTTRDAHLQEFTMSNNGEGISAITDALTFDRDDTAGTSTLTIAPGTGSTQSFANLEPGSTITIADTGYNDGNYTIKSIDSNTQITIESTQLVTPTNAQPENVYIVKNDGTKIDWATSGGVTMAIGTGAASDTITARTAGGFSELSAGDIITIEGSGNSGENDKTFTIGSIDAAGTVITLDTKRFEDETTGGVVDSGGAEAATLTESGGTTYLPAATGNITFTAGPPGTLVAGTTGSLSGLAVGETFTVSGSTGNNKTYTVASNDGTTLRVNDWDISSATWYQGNDQNVEHRLNENRSIDMDFNAIDPAIEKAIRAMGIIAQGVYGTAGGLDQNTDRLDDAMYLLEDSLSFPTSGTPPFGAEQTGSFEQIAFDVGFMQVRVNTANESHESYVGFLDKNIGNIENVNLLEAITTMQDHARTLEASYQVFSRFQELSLNKYL